jgi:hypothetical protein
MAANFRRTSYHSNGSTHESFRGYDTTGWPSFAAHLSADKKDELFFYAVDARLRRSFAYTSTGRLDAQVTTTIYPQRLTRKNFVESDVVAVSYVLCFCREF